MDETHLSPIYLSEKMVILLRHTGEVGWVWRDHPS